MDKMRWLYPGMGIKRWLLLLLLGIFAIAAGAAVILNTPFLSLLEQKLLSVLRDFKFNTLFVGAMLIAIGFLCVGTAIRNGIRSLVTAIKPADVSKLAEHVYRSRSLEKGPRIVTIGGGTGLGTMLRGLKEYSANITAIVTVADDGGSSGRIREELGILPPGDIRNTIVALADTEPLMERLFQYRFSWGAGLTGHSFGNLFIAAMTDITGDFELAVREFSKVLAVRGKVLPSTLSAVRLGAIYQDGSRMVGESRIPQKGKKISRVFLDAPDAEALPEALEAIVQADLVVLGPGSLYTSVIPNLLVKPIAEALASTSAQRIYVCNVMTQPGETDSFTAGDHVLALLKHADYLPVINYVLVNKSRLTQSQTKRYAAQGAYPVEVDFDALKNLGLDIRIGDFLDRQDLARHDSEKLAREILSLSGHHLKYPDNLGVP